MQIPATGFRAVMVSCLNEPPRRDPISSALELAGKLSTSRDTTLLCLEDPNVARGLTEIHGTNVRVFPEYRAGFKASKMDDLRSAATFFEKASPKVRPFDCKEFLQNGTGVFFGKESTVRAAAEWDPKISPNQFTRLDYVPALAIALLHNSFGRPLSKSLLLLFESQVEAHLNALRNFKEERKFTKVSHETISAHSLQDIRLFIELWFLGLGAAGVILILERFVVRSI